MKNCEKYQTVQEREEAFRKVCGSAGSCGRCPINAEGETVTACAFKWLEQDVEPSSLDMIAELQNENLQKHKGGLALIAAVISCREKIKEIWAKQDEEEV